MAENSMRSSGKRKERGVNVRVIQEQKATDNKVRVNNNFDKKTAKKSSKKAAPKATTKKVTKKPVAKKTTKPVEKKVEKKVEQIPKKTIKEPASFSKNVEEFRKKKSPKAPEVILPKPEKRKSQIILRDVAKNRDEIEKQPVKVFTEVPKSEKKTPANEKATGKVTGKAAKPVLASVVLKQTAPAQPRKLTAKEIKEREIEKAISTAKKLPETSKKRRQRTGIIGRLGWARLTLMITCATTAVFALIYFLSMTSANVSLQVAASQSGINATYPEYVPRGYELSDVTSGSGKVTMNFKSEDGTFMISEEASNWDSDALLNNYVKENYAADEYSVVLEQGLTIYMGNSWEVWVNGGILYKLNVKTGSLTKKQLKTIATSL